MTGSIPSVGATRSAPVHTGEAHREDRLMTACRELEGVFLSHLTRALRDTLPDHGSVDAPGADVYGSMLDDHLANVMARDGSSGLAEALYRQLADVSIPRTSGDS